MKYIIYIPDSEPPGTTFNHYGVKGRSGRYKYGSGLYGYQDLRRDGLMSWSLKEEKPDPNNLDIIYRKKFLTKINPYVGKIFTKEELESNSQEVLARAYLERYRRSPDYIKQRVEAMKELHELQKNRTPEQKEELKSKREEVQRLNKFYLKLRGKTIDEETGFHLKDPKQLSKWFRDVPADIQQKYIDEHVYEMAIDASKVNYKRIPTYPDGLTKNCGICAVAYDMRRRGYDVTAKEGYNFRPEFIYKGAEQYKGKDNLFYSNAHLNHVNKNEVWDYAQKEREQAYDRIVSKFKLNYPEESRGIIFGGWSAVRKNGEFVRGGHTFNFERHGGRTYIIDPQSSRIYDIESKSAKDYLSLYYILTASRTDNIEPYGKDLLKNILE